MVVGRVARVAQRDQRIRSPLLERRPRLTLLGLHLLGQLVDGRFELRAHVVGQLTPELQHRRTPAPPHPQLTRREPRPRIFRRRLRHPPRLTSELQRIHVRCPPRPLAIRLPIGQLHHRRQLLVGQTTLHRHRRDRRQRLQRPRRLHLVAHHPRRLAVRAHRGVDPTALVEHPHDRQFLGVELTLLRRPPRDDATPTTPSNGSGTRRPARRTCTDPTTGV